MDASKARVKNYKIAGVVLDRIGHDLSCVYFPGQDKQAKFQGQADSLVFVCTNCLGFSEEKDLCTVQYLVNEDRAQGQPFNLWRKQDGVSFSFGSYFEGLKFSYYNGKDWEKKWDSDRMGGLPLAVKAEIVLNTGEEQTKGFSNIFNIPLAQR